MPNNLEILRTLLSEGEVDGEDWLKLKDALKPIFYRGSFMEWRWGEVRERTKIDVAEKGEELLKNLSGCLDQLVIEYSSYANELYQGRQSRMSFSCDRYFPDWPQYNLNQEQADLANQISTALSKGGRVRERAIMLIYSHAEVSSGQSRKSIAGNVAEQTVEFVLRAIGFKKNADYRSQFKYKGSNTDFVIPCVEDNQVTEVKAFIAVQSSSNDRVRLSTSELHRGARGFLVSLNGCPCASKKTTDIGTDLIAGYKDQLSFYVVIEAEKKRAIADAKDRLSKSAGKEGQEQENIENRVAWLEENAINFDEFSDKLKSLHKPNL